MNTQQIEGMVRMSILVPTIRLGVRDHWQENVGNWIEGFLLDEGQIHTKGKFTYHFYKFRIMGGNVEWAELPHKEGDQIVYGRVPVMEGDICSVKLQNQGHGLMKMYLSRGQGIGSYFRILYEGMKTSQGGANEGAPMHSFDITCHPTMRDPLLLAPVPQKRLPGPEGAEVEEPLPPLDEEQG